MGDNVERTNKKNGNETELKNYIFTQLLLANSQIVYSRHQNIWIFMFNSEHVYSFPLLLKIVFIFLLFVLLAARQTLYGNLHVTRRTSEERKKTTKI